MIEGTIRDLLSEILDEFPIVAGISLAGGIILGTIHYLIVRLIRRANHQRFRLPEFGIVMLASLGLLITPIYLIANHLQEVNQATCSINLRNYNQFILSLGIHLDCNEVWRDPEKTKQRVFEDFQERMPVCPSGGKVTLIDDDTYGPSIPLARCTLEGSHGHINHSSTQEDEP